MHRETSFVFRKVRQTQFFFISLAYKQICNVRDVCAMPQSKTRLHAHNPRQAKVTDIELPNSWCKVYFSFFWVKNVYIIICHSTMVYKAFHFHIVNPL